MREKYRKSREELNFSAMAKVDPSSGEEYCEFQNTISNSDSLYSEDGTVFERIDLELAIEKVAAVVDEKTYTILRKVCLDGCSIKDAASEVPLSHYHTASQPTLAAHGELWAQNCRSASALQRARNQAKTGQPEKKPRRPAPARPQPTGGAESNKPIPRKQKA